MAERPLRPYPPLGDPDRFDEIVRRGTSIRRRRRLATGVGAGGTVATLVLGVVLVVGTGGNDTEGLVADDDDVAPVEETTTTSAPALPEKMTVSLELTDDAVVATVVDPAQPEVDDAQQCVVVVATAGGADVATGYACNGVPGDGAATAVPLDAVLPELQISGCAPQVERVDPDALVPTGDRPATTVFRIDLGALEVTPDDVTVEAVSGRGDGCPGTASESTEIESVASATVEVPAT